MQVDVLAINRREKTVLFGECKWGTGVGIACAALGLIGVATAFWFGAPTERTVFGYAVLGMIIGSLSTWLVMRG